MRNERGSGVLFWTEAGSRWLKNGNFQFWTEASCEWLKKTTVPSIKCHRRQVRCNISNRNFRWVTWIGGSCWENVLQAKIYCYIWWGRQSKKTNSRGSKVLSVGRAEHFGPETHALIIHNATINDSSEDYTRTHRIQKDKRCRKFNTVRQTHRIRKDKRSRTSKTTSRLNRAAFSVGQTRIPRYFRILNEIQMLSAKNKSLEENIHAMYASMESHNSLFQLPKQIENSSHCWLIQQKTTFSKPKRRVDIMMSSKSLCHTLKCWEEVGCTKLFMQTYLTVFHNLLLWIGTLQIKVPDWLKDCWEQMNCLTI